MTQIIRPAAPGSLISMVSNDLLRELRRAIDAGADLCAPSASGLTPASFSAYMLKIEAFEMLIEAGAPWTGAAQDDCGAGLILACSEKGHRRALQLALSRGADPDSRDKYQTSALSHCARHGNHGCLLDLLGAGADPFIVRSGGADSFDEGPLHEAAASRESGSLECLISLIDAGVDVNKRDNRHRATALHRAAQCGDAAKISLLLERGAKDFLKDRKGRAASAVAADNDQGGALALLEAIALAKLAKRHRRALPRIIKSL